MSQLQLAQDDFKREIELLLAPFRDQRLSKFDQRALAWLALVPTWTEQLAQACDFPGKERLRDFLREAEGQGLCLLHQSTNPDRSTWYIAYVYTSLASSLPKARHRDALTFVQQIKDTRLLSQSLAKLAPYLAQEFVPIMLASARTIQDPCVRATPLLALIPRLTNEQRSALFDELLEAAQHVTEVQERTELLLALVPYFEEEKRSTLAQKVLTLSSEVTQEARQVSILTGLIPHLSGEQWDSVLVVAHSLERSESRAQVYITLAMYAPTGMLGDILQEASEVLNSDQDMDKEARTHLLSMFAQALARSGEFDTALRVTEEVLDDDTRVHTFIEVMRAIGKLGKVQQATDLAQRMLKTMLRVTDVAWNVTILSNIAQTLAQIGEKSEATRIAHSALDAVKKLIPAAYDVLVFRDLVVALLQIGEQTEAAQQIEQAFVAARLINNTREQCKTLVNLLQYVPSQRQDQEARTILEMIRAIGDSGDRIQELVHVAPYFREDDLLVMLDEALRMARDMQEEFSFWMPDTARNDVLVSLSQQNDPDFLVTQIQNIGPRILQAQNDGQPISPAVVRWAELAARDQDGTERVARWLDRQIEQLVKAGDTGQALAWVNTATTLFPVLQGELEMSIIVGNRRVELAYRQSQDKRHLQYFLKRQEQIDDFLILLLPKPSGHPIWALHYVGMGGVGKTTLIRYITASVASGLPTSRVDFDYLNPDYPSRRPGQLLIELAKELQSYGTSRQHDELFRSFQQRVVSFHEMLSNSLTTSDPLASIRHSEFNRVIQAFNDFLNILPQPVVLILDTCEELAKFQPPGAEPPNLKATFDILERIHNAVPTVRVVFAGRRFLARGGAGWSLDEQHIQDGHALLQEKKDYLRLHEIRGFTKEEASSYLTSIKKLDISAELQQAMLRRSPDPGTPAFVEWTPPRKVEQSTRYNPFDLALYADWVREDPRVTPDIINQGKTDPYVEMRILNRIRQDEVLALLPSAILLRRFDQEMLQLAFYGSNAAFSEVYRELGLLEWIEYQPEESTAFLEIDRNLYPRLLGYYRHPDRRWLLEAAGQRLRPGLLKMIERLPLHQLRIEYIEAAMRLLPEEQAATLWHGLAESIADKATWGRAHALTERLLDNNDPVIGMQHPARAIVRATFTAVMLHEQPTLPVMPFWDEVAQTVHTDPDPIVREWLQQRAFAGHIAAMARAQSTPSNAHLANFWHIVAQFQHSIGDVMNADTYRLEQFAGSLCAAIDALLELAEQKNMRGFIPDSEAVASWAEALQKGSISLEVRAFALMLAGRAMALYERWIEASQLFEKACNALPEDVAQSYHQRWADWRIPDSLHDRVRIEALRIIPRHLLNIPMSTWLRWQQEAVSRLPLIDADRLVSYTLTLRLAYELVQKAELEGLADKDLYQSDRQPACYSHRVILPLFATRALALLAVGEGSDALSVVDERIQVATKSGLDKENTIQAAENTKAHIIRRMRVAKNSPTFIERYALSNNRENRVTIWPAITLGSSANKLIPSSIPTDNASLTHAWWRCSQTTPNGTVSDLLGDLRHVFLLPSIGPLDAFDKISLAMDMREAHLLLKETREEYDIFSGIDSWFIAHPGQTEQGLRLWLRGMALGIASLDFEQESERLLEWARQVGVRWIAELALDEGELLALRLPQQAKTLLDLSYRMFSEAKDNVGAFIAITCSVLAAIRAGVSPDIYQILKNRLKTAYEQLPGLSTITWVPWDELLNMLPPQRMQSTSIWLGWLERLISCILWLDAAEDGDVEPLNRLTRDWLIPQYGEPLQGELQLPMPRTQLKSEEVKEVDRLDVSTPSLPSSRRILASLLWLIALSASVLVLLIIVGIILFSSHQTHLGLAYGSSNIITLCIGLLIPPFLAGAYILARWQIRTIQAEFAAHTILTLTIDGNSISSWRRLSSDQVDNTLMQMHQRRQVLRLGWPPTNLRPEEAIFDTGYIPGVQKYRGIVGTLSTKVVKQLTSLQKRLEGRQLPIPLIINPGLHAIPWEALFTLALPQASQTLWNETFQFWRRGEPPLTYQVAPSPSQGREPILGILCSSDWRLTVSRGWRALRGYNVSVSDRLNELGRLENGIQVLHVICTPTLTASGWLLQISRSDQTRKYNTTVEQTVQGDDLSHLIRIESLPFTSASLVVIQAEPVETIQRRDTEREQTADLRTCAAMIFTAGAKTVVMLPALPPLLTESVLNRLATCYRDQEVPDLQRLLNAVSEIRGIIATWNSSDSDGRSQIIHEQIASETQLELALDVCIFTCSTAL